MLSSFPKWVITYLDLFLFVEEVLLELARALLVGDLAVRGLDLLHVEVTESKVVAHERFLCYFLWPADS